METRPIRKNYSHVIADENKKRKRKHAEARQELRNNRSPEQQLAKLDAEGWGAKKERARLMKQID